MSQDTIVENALWRMGVQEAGASFARGDIRPSEVLESVLSRIDEVNPSLNAFATLDAKGARIAAQQSDGRWQKGERRGPLDGIVLTIKDNIPVGGLPCMWGSEVFRDFVPEKDELTVQRLRDAGAIILGKTNVSEFSTGRGIVSTRLRGTTRNPWNPEMTTGSSSGGAVAAVASGMSTAALGTDGGGSIRTPASHTGLVGLKPTQGRVARAHGLPITSGGREVAAPVARSTEDLALVFAAIAKSHPLDANSWGFTDEPMSFSKTPPRQRIRLFTKVGDYPVSPDVVAAVTEVGENLSKLGHIVKSGDAPYDIKLQLKGGEIGQAGLAWMLRDRDWKGRIHEYYVRQTEAGMKLSATDYVDALAKLRTVQGQVGEFFENYDLTLSPVTVAPPHPAEEPAPSYYNIFTSFVNTAGIPAISIPARLSTAGLPIGFQLAGRFGSDWNLISLAYEYEQNFSWLNRRPPI